MKTYAAEFTAHGGGVYVAELMATTQAAAICEAWDGWRTELRAVYHTPGGIGALNATTPAVWRRNAPGC